MGTMNISEINQKKLSLLDVSQLKAFLDIFKGVSNPKAKQIVKDLSLELRGRKTEEVEEASITDLIKAVKFASKKIGGIVGDVMNDAEFQKAYAKYIDNPNDKNRLKKIQDYTNGMLGDMSEDLEEVSAQDKVAALAAIGAAAALKKRFSRKGRADAAEKKVKKQDDKEADKARLQKAKKELANKKKKKRLQKATDALKDAKTPAQKDDAKERIAKIKKSMQEQRLIKVCSIVLGEDFNETFIYEDVDFTKPSVIKEAYKKFIKENRAIVYNPRMIRAFIKKAEKKFPKYKGEIQQIEKDEIIFPNDEKLRDFFRGAKEVKFVLRDSVDLEEKKVIAQVELWNGKKMKKSFKDQSSAEKFIKKTQDEEDVRGYNMYAEGLGEAVKFWTVTITKKAGKLFKGQTVDVKASNSAEAIKKGIKQMKGNPALVPSDSVDAVLGESTK